MQLSAANITGTGVQTDEKPREITRKLQASADAQTSPAEGLPTVPPTQPSQECVKLY